MATKSQVNRANKSICWFATNRWEKKYLCRNAKKAKTDKRGYSRANRRLSKIMENNLEAC